MLFLCLGLAVWLSLVWLYDRRQSSQGGQRQPWWPWLWGIPLLLTGFMVLLLRSDMVLQKLAGRLLMPTGLLWVILGCVGSAAWLRRQRGAAVRWTALFIAYSVAGSPLLSTVLMNHLESSVPSYDIATGPSFDVVFVLGGGSGDGRTRPELDAAGDRVFLGGLLYREGKTPILVASGRSISGIGPARDLSAETATIWQQMGVPQAAIIQISDPTNTSQEMAAYGRLVEERGWTRLGLISSAYHLPRALKLAERHGLHMTPIPADVRADIMPPAALAFVPFGPAFDTMNLVCWEILGRWLGR